MMREDLRRLIEIQKIDNEITVEETQQRTLQEEMDKDRAVVQEAKDRLKDDREELLELRKQIDRKNLDVKEKEEAIEKDRDILSKVTSNKEYKAILAQVERDRADLSIVEVEILEAMAGSDKVEEDLKTVENSLKEKESALAEKEKEVGKQVNSSAERVSSLEAERSAVTTEVDAELIEIYDRLYGRGDGQVVAASDRGMCGGCNMTLTPQTTSKLIGGEEIIRCMSCGRIIYLRDEQAEE